MIAEQKCQRYISCKCISIKHIRCTNLRFMSFCKQNYALNWNLKSPNLVKQVILIYLCVWDSVKYFSKRLFGNSVALIQSGHVISSVLECDWHFRANFSYLNLAWSQRLKVSVHVHKKTNVLSVSESEWQQRACFFTHYISAA